MTTIRTRASAWKKLATTNVTTTAFPDAAVTTTYTSLTEPTETYAGAAVSPIRDIPIEKGGEVPTNLRVMFFGEGAENTTFEVRILGWAAVWNAAQTAILSWQATPLWQGVITLSTAIGLATGALVAADRIADTIVPATGYNAIDDETSPTVNVPGHLLLDIRGFAKIQFDFDMTGATNGNALISYMD